MQICWMYSTSARGNCYCKHANDKKTTAVATLLCLYGDPTAGCCGGGTLLASVSVADHRGKDKQHVGQLLGLDEG